MITLSLTPRDPPRRQLRTWIGSHLLPHPPSRPDLAPREFHLFPKMNEDLRGHLCDSNEEAESTLRSRTKKQSVELTALRNLSVIGGSVRSIVVIWGAVSTGDKRAHVKTYFRVSFINLDDDYVMHQQVWHSTTVRSAHTVFMCFWFIWEQTATCATYCINWLVFITEMKSVYSAVRTGSLTL